MKRITLITVAMLAALLALPMTAAAHGHVEVGEYELVIGFREEPAFAGEPNGLDLRVTQHESGEPVAGLESSLKAEIIRGEARREIKLRPRFGQEGAYTGDLLATEAGDYTWRIWGTIGETPVDVSMTSGPDTFSVMQAKDTVAFPAAEPAAKDIAAAAASARQLAQTALVVGGLGLLAGIAGVALALSSRRRPLA